MQVATREAGVVSLLLPGALLVGLLAAIAGQTTGLQLPWLAPALAGPETVTIAPRSYAYRATGDFLSGRQTIDGPMVTMDNPPALDIMTYQVSEADYGHCVADGACKAADPKRRGKGNVAVTGVSFRDATDYAAWLSEETGATWRLPTVAEWTFAAGSKAVDPSLGSGSETTDPAERWLALYEKEAAFGSDALATPEPLGSLGVNEFGVADLGGVVWEWTATCGGRTTFGPSGDIVSQLDSCGVRYLEGKHRTGMNIFVRDALTGGCSTGIPPDNLGFRLVRERPWYAPILTAFQQR